MNLAEVFELDDSSSAIRRFDSEIVKVLPISSVFHDETSISWCSITNSSKLCSIHNTNIIIDKNTVASCLQQDCNYILCENPRRLFQLMVGKFFVQKIVHKIEDSATIASDVVLGVNTSIGHNVVIEHNCIIGDNVIIDHNTIIKHGTQIGNNVVIGCNNVIGGVGFGYEKNKDNEYELIPHIGNVILYDNVEIGNNTCIDRAVLGNTILYENVKVDNLVHIAHGVEVGRNTVIIANSMIGGSTKIGNDSWVAPSATVINKVNIGDNAVIGLGAVVIRDVENQNVVVGNPAKVIRSNKS